MVLRCVGLVNGGQMKRRRKRPRRGPVCFINLSAAIPSGHERKGQRPHAGGTMWKKGRDDDKEKYVYDNTEVMSHRGVGNYPTFGLEVLKLSTRDGSVRAERTGWRGGQLGADSRCCPSPAHRCNVINAQRCQGPERDQIHRVLAGTRL